MALLPALHRLYRPWAAWRFGKLAESYAGTARSDPQYLEPLRAVLPALPRSPRTILEIGAGTGAATALLLRTFPGAEVIALDGSQTMLARLRYDLGSAYPVLADARALPVRTGSCDLVLAHNAPFHPGEMRRAAAAGGSIVVVLSSAGRMPAALRRRLAAALAGPAGPPAVEHRAGAGIAFVSRRGEEPTAGAR